VFGYIAGFGEAFPPESQCRTVFFERTVNGGRTYLQQLFPDIRRDAKGRP
jgi:hypothetical protein